MFEGRISPLNLSRLRAAPKSQSSGARPGRAALVPAALVLLGAVIMPVTAGGGLPLQDTHDSAEVAAGGSGTAAMTTSILRDLAATGRGSQLRIALGKAIFFDEQLSEPAGTSCASCHTPDRAFSGNHGSSIGVAQGSRPGHFARRNTPSLLYLRYVPPFHFHADDDAIQPSPYGGFFWDGRGASIAELVRQPLLNPDEMNNRDLS